MWAEFHPRPSCGWANFDDRIPDHEVAWELWIDNGSGTYAPPTDMLNSLRGLLEYNWPGLQVRTFDFRVSSLNSIGERIVTSPLPL
jgi:hypothetical protein